MGGVSDPLDCLWNEGWKKPVRPWEYSPLKAGEARRYLKEFYTYFEVE